MELKILDESYYIENKFDNIKEVFELIQEKLDVTEYYFSNLCIDGIEIFNEYESFIIDNLADIRIIEVVVKTIKEFRNELLLSLGKYLNNSLPEIELLTTKIYQSSDMIKSNDFIQFIEGLMWILDAISNIDNLKEKPDEWNQVIIAVTKLQQELVGLEEGINNADTVLVGDIMNYELVPILKKLQQYIILVIDNEVFRNDTN